MSTNSPFALNLPKTTAASTTFSFGSIAAANAGGIGNTNTSVFGNKPAVTAVSTTITQVGTAAAFNFGLPAVKPAAATFGSQGFGLTSTVAATTIAPTASTTPGFSFQSGATGAVPYSFGATTSAATTTQSAGIRPAFGFGLPATSLTATTVGSAASGQPAFGLTASGTTAPSTFPAANSTSPATLGLFGSPMTKSAVTASSTSIAPFFGNPTAAASATTCVGQPQPVITAPSLAGLASFKTTTSTPLNLSSAQPAALGKTTTSGLPLQQNLVSTATTAAGSLAFPGGTLKFDSGGGTVTTTTHFGTVTSTTTTTASGPTSASVMTTSVTSANLVSSNAATSGTGTKVPAAMTYSQLEEMINKWTHELDEQERYFSDEASRINSWDQALLTNGEKIAGLYEKVEACKKDQAQLEQEFDLIESQQRELDGLLEAVEKASNDLLPRSQLHSDFEREVVLQMASNVDLELGQLLCELRDIGNRVASTTTQETVTVGMGDSSLSEVQDDRKRSSDILNSQLADTGPGPTAVQQVTRILNCHMQSLNWIHQNTQELMERVKALENP